ncbi:sugar transferase [Pseudonocardia bannensis]
MADLLIVVTGVLVAFPILLLIVVLIRLDSPGPVLFRQERVGRNKSLFTLYKFRTMYVGEDDHAHRELITRELQGKVTVIDGSSKLHADPRVTRIGRFLRRTSLDELPQIINILRGEMALVGPRPCLPWEARMFPSEFDDRFSVKPGITGLWQISGRSRLGTLDMLDLDVAYVKARGFWRDLVIIILTIPCFFHGDGAK